MAIPSISDLAVFTTIPLDDNDWLDNWTQVVNWLTDGQANLTVASITGMANLKQYTSAQILALTGMAEGSVVMNTDSHKPMYYDGYSWQTFA